MSDLFYIVIAVIAVVVSGFLIAALIEVRAAAREAATLLKTAETTIKPTMEELDETLKSLRNVSDQFGGVTEDVRQFSSAVSDVGGNIRDINKVIGILPARAAWISAGIKAALKVLAGNIIKKSNK